jgi:excisionase family DNA binding protein
MLDQIPSPLRTGLTQTEVAKVLGVTRQTLNNWVHKEYGPQPVRDGRHLLYDRAAIEAFARGAH